MDVSFFILANARKFVYLFTDATGNKPDLQINITIASYDPGRTQSITYPGGLVVSYTYVSSNPINFVDPLGTIYITGVLFFVRLESNGSERSVPEAFPQMNIASQFVLQALSGDRDTNRFVNAVSAMTTAKCARYANAYRKCGYPLLPPDVRKGLMDQGIEPPELADSEESTDSSVPSSDDQTDN